MKFDKGALCIESRGSYPDELTVKKVVDDNIYVRDFFPK